MEEFVDQLIKQGCKPLAKKPMAIALQCHDSIIIKSPSMQTVVMIPIKKLDALRKRLVGTKFNHASVDVGGFDPRGSSGKVFQFQFNNEVTFTNTIESLQNVKDDRIARIHGDITNIQNLYHESTRHINMFDEFRKKTTELADALSDVIANDIRDRSENRSIFCKTTTNVSRNFDLKKKGEYPVANFRTRCIVPDVEKKIDIVVKSILEEGSINQYDARFLTSHMTHDKGLLLSGINIYQRGANLPLFQFAVDKDARVTSPKFQDILVTLEQQFGNTNERDIPLLDARVLNKYLF